MCTRKTQWKVQGIQYGIYCTYGPYNENILNFLLEKGAFEDLQNMKFIQCVELEPGEVLIGDRVFYNG